jgi:hypothetical protein
MGLRAMSFAARTMVTSLLALACTSGALAQENIAPLGTPIIGASSSLTTLGVIVDHAGPIEETNDGVFNANLAPNGFLIDADGQLGPNGNGVDTFAGGVTENRFDFVGVLFDAAQYGVSSVRVQNFIANDGGWWGENGVVAGGVPLLAADLAAPNVQVTSDGGATWSTVVSLSNDYVAQLTGVVRGTGFPFATSTPFATFNIPQQNGIDGIRLIASGGGPADGNGFVGVNEFEVIGVPQRLTLEVNTLTGRVRLVNDVQTSIDFDLYRIDSAAGSLDLSPGGWNSLENPLGNPMGFPSGDGSGNGWEALGNPSDKLVAEAFLTGASTLAPGEAITLGALFETGGAQDLALRYRTSAGSLVEIAATYVANPAADFNNNGVVGSADLSLWQSSYGSGLAGDADQDGDSDGQDFLVWQQQLGASGLVAVRNVPEPACTVLALGCLAAWRSITRRRAFGGY